MDYKDHNDEKNELMHEIKDMVGSSKGDGEPEGDELENLIRPRKDFKLHLSDEDLQNPGGDEPLPADEEFFGSEPESEEVTFEHKEEPVMPRKPKKKVKRKGCLNALLYSAVLIVFSIFLALLIIAGANDAYAIVKTNQTIAVTIPQNSSIDKIAGILQEDGVIRYGFLFNFYAKTEKVKKLSNGNFTLNSNMTYSEILKALQIVPGARQVVRITIPEGYTLQQIGETLEKKKVCGKQAFLDMCDSKSIKFDYSSQIPDNNKRFYRLEGYLFPDTYDFYVGSSPSEVIYKMLANFDDKFDPDLQDQAKAMKMSVDQVVTLASIIQIEASAASEDDMAHVSSVFHNRLEKGSGSMSYLQSDATIFYVKQDINTALKKSDTEIDSPYNTYKNPGLTPGAICNPGITAIKAALYPSNSKDYYFVTYQDSKNAFHYLFSESYTQHLANVTKANRLNKSGNNTKGTDVVQ